MKRSLALVLMALMLIGLTMSLTACGSGSSPETASLGIEETDSVTGIYTNIITGEEMRDRLVGSWSQVTHLDTLVQYNTLVLTAQNTTITDGDRYMLSKVLYNGEMGIHIEAHFYGDYSFNGTEVTLAIPDYYTWIYYRNGRIMGDSYVYQPVDLASTASDGASFCGDYLDYHGYHRVEQDMSVTVNMKDTTFTFNLEENDDGVDLGAESEDDGFNAGPIFGAAVVDDAADEVTSGEDSSNEDAFSSTVG